MSKKPFFREFLDASIIGIQFVCSIFIGLALGYGLDYAMEEWFGVRTSPLFTLIFLAAGIVAGFRELYKIAVRQK